MRSDEIFQNIKNNYKSSTSQKNFNPNDVLEEIGLRNKKNNGENGADFTEKDDVKLRNNTVDYNNFVKPQEKSYYVAGPVANNEISSTAQTPEELEYEANTADDEKQKDNYFGLTKISQNKEDIVKNVIKTVVQSPNVLLGATNAIGKLAVKTTEDVVMEGLRGFANSSVDFASSMTRFFGQNYMYFKGYKEEQLDKIANLGNVISGGEDLSDEIKQKYTDFYNRIDKQTKIFKDKTEKFLQYTGIAKTDKDGFVYDLVGGASSLMYAIGIAVVTKSPLATAEFFGAYQYQGLYEESIEKGFSPIKARTIGLIGGTAEAVLECVGLDVLLKTLVARKSFTKILKASATEFIQEASQQGAEEIITNVGGLRNESLKNILVNVGYAGVIGALLGGSSAGVTNMRFFQKKISDSAVRELINIGCKSEYAKLMVNNMLDFSVSPQVADEMEKILKDEQSPVTYKKSDPRETYKECGETIKKTLNPEEKRNIEIEFINANKKFTQQYANVLYNSGKFKTKDEAYRQAETATAIYDVLAREAYNQDNISPDQYYQRFHINAQNANIEMDERNVDEDNPFYDVSFDPVDFDETARAEYEAAMDAEQEYIDSLQEENKSTLKSEARILGDMGIGAIRKPTPDGYGKERWSEYNDLSPRIKKYFFTDSQTAMKWDEAEDLLANSGSSIKDLFEYLTAVDNRAVKLNQEGVFSRLLNKEKENIKQQAIANGTFLKAPNGKDSNLPEQLWLTVRTKAFKSWFGDWENDPANASKVVDENGEPLVVFHGTNADFSIFEGQKIKNTSEGAGFYFTPNKNLASGFGNIKATFLNIRNPQYAYGNIDLVSDTYEEDYEKENKEAIDKGLQEIKKKLEKKGYKFYKQVQKDLFDVIGTQTQEVLDGLLYLSSFVENENFDEEKIYNDIREAEKEVFRVDGYTTNKYGGDQKVYVAFTSNQIKSINNRGSFDNNNPDIYFQDAYQQTPLDFNSIYEKQTKKILDKYEADKKLAEDEKIEETNNRLIKDYNEKEEKVKKYLFELFDEYIQKVQKNPNAKYVKSIGGLTVEDLEKGNVRGLKRGKNNITYTDFSSPTYIYRNLFWNLLKEGHQTVRKYLSNKIQEKGLEIPKKTELKEEIKFSYENPMKEIYDNSYLGKKYQGKYFNVLSKSYVDKDNATVIFNNIYNDNSSNNVLDTKPILKELDRLLQKNGWVRYYSSGKTIGEGSLYYSLAEDFYRGKKGQRAIRIRLSDHQLPMYGEREYRYNNNQAGYDYEYIISSDLAKHFWVQPDKKSFDLLAKQVIDVLAKNGDIFFQDAYHGTPHIFDLFSTDNIGTGEGAQAHGWGLYFAKNKDVSERYREALASSNIDIFSEGKKISENDKSEIIALISPSNLENKKDFAFAVKNIIAINEDLIRENNGNIDERKRIINILKKINLDNFEIKKQKGQLFQVDIPENDVLLDEQKTFDEQPEKVKENLKKLFKSEEFKNEFFGYIQNEVDNDYLKILKKYYDAVVTNFNIDKQNEISKELTKFEQEHPYMFDDIEDINIEDTPASIIETIGQIVGNDTELTGKEIYGLLTKINTLSQKGASLLLNKYGIKGITYDGRQDGRAYVIFDDKAIKILEKFYQREIKQIEEKIFKVKEEEKKRFDKDVDILLKDKKKKDDDTAYVGEIPFLYKVLGIEPGSVFIEKGNIKKDLGKTKKYKNHDVDIKEIKNIPELYTNPLIVMKSLTEENSLIAVLDATDISGRQIVLAIHPNKYGMGLHAIPSAYGKDDIVKLIKNTDNVNGVVYVENKNSPPASWLLSPISNLRSNNNILQKSDIVKRFATLQQEQQQQDNPRGSITIFDRQYWIELYSSADKSTLLHESSHAFLSEVLYFANGKNPSAKILNIKKQLDDWLGVPENNGRYSTRQQELFAKSSETYFREGKAPTAKLKTVFEKFKKWLANIYDSIKDDLPKINDDVRELFDTILSRSYDVPDSNIYAGKEKAIKEVIKNINEGRASEVDGITIDDVYNLLNVAYVRKPSKPTKNLKQLLNEKNIYDFNELNKAGAESVLQMLKDGGYVKEDATAEQAVDLAKQALDGSPVYRLADQIKQINKTNHTKENRTERLTDLAKFDGKVVKGQEYILVDDVLTTGSNINELRKYIERRGGKVIHVAVLATGIRGKEVFQPVVAETKKNLYDKFERILNGQEKTETNITNEQQQQQEQNVDTTGNRRNDGRFPQGRQNNKRVRSESDLHRLVNLYLQSKNITNSVEELTEGQARDMLSDKFVIDEKHLFELLNSQFFQKQQQQDNPRGATTVFDRQYWIELYSSADKSTLLHESSHAFLSEILYFANGKNPSPKILNIKKQLDDWLGPPENNGRYSTRHNIQLSSRPNSINKTILQKCCLRSYFF